jgi:hypothetical protein
MFTAITNDQLVALGLLIYLIILGFFLYHLAYEDGYKARDKEIDKHRFDFENEDKKQAS